MADQPNIRLGDFFKGEVSRKVKSLDYPADALVRGLNVMLAEGGVATRPGSSITKPAENVPTSTLVALSQFVAPTNEQTYVVVQEHGTAVASWEAIATGPSRYFHSMVWDSGNGRALLFGGGDGVAAYYNDLRSYDPITDAWTTLSPTGTAPTARYGHSAVYVPAQEAMYVFGGRDVTGNKNDLFKLDCTTDVWSEITDSGSVPAARYGHAACLIGTGTMMISGGKGTGTYYAGSTYYDLNLSTYAWTEIVATTGGSSMGARYIHSISYDGSQYVYLVGGNVNDESFSRTVWKINRTAGTYSSLLDYPNSNGIGGHFAYYCSGYVVVVCGKGDVIYSYNDSYKTYSCSGNVWTTVVPSGDVGLRYLLTGCVTDTGDIIVHGGISDYDPSTVYETSGYMASSLCGSGVGTAIIGVYNLYASNANLPSTAQTFEHIYTLGSTAGVCSFATLGDRLIITEGQYAVPLVFLPGTLSTDTVDEYASPSRVILDYGSESYHDVSDKVLDNDLDSYADIGGVTTRGAIYFCCDVPTVQKFYLEFETPNNLAGATTEFSSSSVLDDEIYVVRENIGNGIARWVKDAADPDMTGHFEGAAKALAGAAVDLGGGLVKVPCVGHGFVETDTVEIYNTVAYDQTEVLPSQAAGDADHFVITAPYIVEVFAGNDEARKRFTLGTGKNAPLVEAGVQIEFDNGAIASVVAITSDGELDDEVEISTSNVTDNCQIYGIIVTDANVVSLGTGVDAPETLTSFVPNSYGGFTQARSYRQVVKGSDIASDSAYVRFKFQSGNSRTLPILSAGVVERSGTTGDGTTTPTQITFNNGSAGVVVPVKYPDWGPAATPATRQYNVGQYVAAGSPSVVYECTTTHWSSTNFYNDLALGYWSATTYPIYPQAWYPYSSYALNAFVTPGGGMVVYRCIVPHQASTSFSADLGAGKWVYMPGYPTYVQSWCGVLAYVTYPLGSRVVVDEVVYKCLIAHNSTLWGPDLSAGKWEATDEDPGYIWSDFITFTMDNAKDYLVIIDVGVA